MRPVLFTVLAAISAWGQKPSFDELSAMLRTSSPELKQAIAAATGADALTKGTAVISRGPDFIWAFESDAEPSIVIDWSEPRKMRRVNGTNLWVYQTKLKTGTAHTYQFIVTGREHGEPRDIAAFGPESYERPGVPRGRLSEKFVHASTIYPGMQTDYWVYTPAQYDAARPAALMVWQDGQNWIARESSRAQIVFDNLTHQKRIPVIVHVFVAPGMIGEKRMRSIEYDTVNDTYASFLRDEILSEVYKRWNIRRDGYSRAIAGNSSGGICAFNVAWHQPDQFSRVLSRIGSFTSIQWRPGLLDGGNVYPFKIRKEPKRNIRVWLQDGANDLENDHGSWPLQNVQMANSLKMKNYDFHLSWGTGVHSGAAGNAELPEELVWLWRNYDPSKTEQVYEMETSERSKPLFRVTIANR
jgi:enterochelin esterase family protein